MHRTWIGLLCSVGVLAACSDKLPKEEADLLDAMMFVWTGIEDNTKENYGLGPWRRKVTGRSIEFSILRRNGIGTSDEETNKIIRKSSYVLDVRKISLTAPCAFKMEDETRFSKGDSQEDFSAYS